MSKHEIALWLYDLINSGLAEFSPSGRFLVDKLSGEILLDAKDNSISELLKSSYANYEISIC